MSCADRPRKETEVREKFGFFFRKDFKIYAEPIDNPANTKGELVGIGEDIEKLVTQAKTEAKIEVLEEVALETRANVCECGEKWCETDLGIWVEKMLSNLKKKKK
jgi:hypothetical protein